MRFAWSILVLINLHEMSLLNWESISTTQFIVWIWIIKFSKLILQLNFKYQKEAFYICYFQINEEQEKPVPSNTDTNVAILKVAKNYNNC